MLKETRTYKDFDGKERTEDFYFNLSKAELMELEASVDGGWLNSMKRIISAQNNPAIMREFKNMILSSYGEKSPDGKRFIKSPELSKAFSETEAYSDMFVEFFRHPDRAAKFFAGILPAELKAEFADAIAADGAALPAQS